MSIELRRARRKRLHNRRTRHQRLRDLERMAGKDARAIAASVEALPTGWGGAPEGWLLEELGFYGLDAVEEGILIALVTGEPILLVGRHGTAKTAICCRLGEVLDLRFHAYDAAKALFEDVVGFPSPSSLARGEVSYVPTPMSLWDKEFILVDELSRAQPQMQNKWLEVIRSHRLMGQALPKLRHVIAAMNPTDYLGAVPLDEALLSRFAVVLRMPEVAEMGEATAQKVISARSADDAPLVGDALAGAPTSPDDVRRIRRRLRRRLSVALRRLSAVESIFGTAVTRYVHEVSLHLAERGHSMDARRLGMVRRNLLVALALASGERALDEDGGSEVDPAEDAFPRYGASVAEVSSIVGRTLSFSLPFEADGRPGPSADILSTIHRAAFDEAFGDHPDSSTLSQGCATGRVARGSRRQLVAYRQRISDLPLEEHYRMTNDLLQRAQEAPAERLLRAWDDLLALGEVVRGNPGAVPWEVTEHLLDGLAVQFGIAETSAASLVTLCRDQRIDSNRSDSARIARQCQARVSLTTRGDHDDAARLIKRLRDQGGAL